MGRIQSLTEVVAFVLILLIVFMAGRTFHGDRQLVVTQAEQIREQGKAIDELREDDPRPVDGSVYVEMLPSTADQPLEFVPILFYKSTTPQARACGLVQDRDGKSVLLGMNDEVIGNVVGGPHDPEYIAAQKKKE